MTQRSAKCLVNHLENLENLTLKTLEWLTLKTLEWLRLGVEEREDTPFWSLPSFQNCDREARHRHN